MKKKTVGDVDLRGKKVLMRVDFNVPLKDGEISDDTRIQAALPTINYLLVQNASLILMSHMGRPKGKAKPEMSLQVTAARLGELLDKEVKMAPDCLGPEVAAMAAALRPGEVLMLENTRFHAAEEGKVQTETLSEEGTKAAKAKMKEEQKNMARKLASLAEVYVNDAFGSAHRAHASTTVIAGFMEVAVAGFLMEKEMKYLGQALNKPAHPFVAIIGGAKISGKLEVLKSLLQRVDTLLIGGAMAYTFLKAQGKEIGDSLCENELRDVARETMAAAGRAGVKLLLPVDNVISDGKEIKVESGDFGSGWSGMDIGPETVKLFCEEIAKAKMIVWNGPMGKFEEDEFAKGTYAVCRAVADSGAISIIGGGDSVSAVNQSGLAAKMTHISTGGGASLEFLEGKVLPGIACLNDKPPPGKES